MDLLLWRHAHALDASIGQSDLDRPLSAKGESHAKKMADWLQTRLPKGIHILCSPALRTRQTVDRMNVPYTICDELAPDSNASNLLKLVDWYSENSSPSLVVAHQPFLADTVSYIFGLQTSEPISFRKGSLWWIRRRKPTDQRKESYLFTIQDPDLL
jgi:phosphohistidine phosphatase